jgi:hypothetical protein
VESAAHIKARESHSHRRRSGFIPDQRLQLCPGAHLPENEIIDLFLHATALGLFSMDWSLYCPQCCCVVESFRSLKSLHNHYHCAFCQVGYDAALDEYIAVAFTVSPNIRKIRFMIPTNSRPGTSFSRHRTRPKACCPMASRW